MATSRPRFETSAGGVVYRFNNAHARFLLIRDSYRNWGFPKGHVETGEHAEAAALREVAEETGLRDLTLRGPIETIDWYFRSRGQLIHKVCHFFLMETAEVDTYPQCDEGITACRWAAFDEAKTLLSHANARKVLARARIMVKTLSPSGAR